jgi:hypothetical protein
MKYSLIEIDLNKIILNHQYEESHSEANFIYDDLCYFCSKFSPLPTITIEIKSDFIFVKSGYVYIRIAKELKRSIIRAVISDDSDKLRVIELEQLGEIKFLNWKEIRDEETAIGFAFHVFFFEKDLSSNEEILFRKMVYKHFEFQEYLSETERANAVNSFAYSKSDQCVEFSGLTPIDNTEFANRFLQRLVNFHSSVVKIRSYQGRKFLIV